MNKVLLSLTLAAVSTLAACKSSSTDPVSILAVRDCSHLVGIIVSTPDGALHNQNGPFTPEQLAQIKKWGDAIQGSHKATLIMPCAPQAQEQHQGETST